MTTVYYPRGDNHIRRSWLYLRPDALLGWLGPPLRCDPATTLGSTESLYWGWR